MKKLAFVTMILFTICLKNVDAQTFTITDVTAENVSYSDLQKKKLLMLGAKINLTFYDSSVKLEITTDNNSYSEMVLNKTLYSYKYTAIDGNLTYTLTLRKGYIYSTSYDLGTITVSAEIVPYTVSYIYSLKKI